jgi:ABC-type transport system involved in multi-copper enzyme maturation permease subunit
MTSIWIIARLTFREASRRWILWAALLLGVAFLIVYGLGYNEIHKDMLRYNNNMSALMLSEMNNVFLMAGLYVVNFLTIMMAVLTSVDTLSGEIASGTIHTIVSKPVRRWQVLLGKWLGFVLMLTLYLLLLAGGVMLVIRVLGGYTAPHAWRGLTLMWLNVILMMTISLLGGTFFSTLANGALVFGLYSVAFIGGWIEQIGSMLGSTTAVRIGILCSLLIPSEALWRRAAYEMQSPLVTMLGGASPFSTRSVPSVYMILYAVLYLLLALGVAIWRFEKRDL